MRKGQKKRIWTVEQKMEIVHKHLDEHISIKKLGKEYGVGHGQVSVWTKKYLEGGETALAARPGNKFAALHTSKSLSEVERLRLLVAKQEIEIARLKKGYWVEGSGANKEYVTGQGKSMKSSKN